MIPRKGWHKGLLPLLLGLLISSRWPAIKADKEFGSRVLVLLEDLALRHTHSLYFAELQARGYDLDFRAATDRKLQLRQWDAWLYDKLVVFVSGTPEFGGAVDGEAILDFVNAGHDIVLAVDSRVSDELRVLAADLGVDLEPKGTAVVDSGDPVVGATVDHRVVAAGEALASAALLGSYDSRGLVLFKGVAASISPESRLAVALLRAPDTAVSRPHAKPLGDDPSLAGGQAVLLAAVQSRGGARALVSGSLDLFSNDFFTTSVATQSGRRADMASNGPLCGEATAWAFRERGVLRASPFRHRHAGGGDPPDWYRISDPLHVELDIHELRDGQWVPYRADDVQLEFTMLDPHVRTNLSHDSQGRYWADFKAPDVYGVFKFVLDHHRLGYTPLEASLQIPVRPFRHNEFERFLVAAYPYYASTFSSMAAFLLLGAYFLYHK